MTMPVLDLAAIEQAEVHKDPHPHAVIRRSFVSDALARALRDEFACDGFTRHERHTAGPGGKRYLMYNHQVILAGEPVADSVAALSATWRTLVGELLDPRYRATVAKLTGVDLSRCQLEARLDRYGEGCWIEPHVDRPDKVVTQLLYFNDPWLPEWNGEFRVLRGPRFDACARAVLPRLGTSVIMRRGDRSWHGVPPVAGGSGYRCWCTLSPINASGSWGRDGNGRLTNQVFATHQQKHRAPSARVVSRLPPRDSARQHPGRARGFRCGLRHALPARTSDERLRPPYE